MVGHSTIRAHVMGLGRSLDRRVDPMPARSPPWTGWSTSRWTPDCSDCRSTCCPGTRWAATASGADPRRRCSPGSPSTARLAEAVRRRDAVFQAIPNLQTRWSIGPLLDMSRPRRGRAMRTSLLTLMDAPPAMGDLPGDGRGDQLLQLAARGARVRFQALPTPFDLYTDGMENPVIEEFGAGTEALHLEDLAARRALMGSPVYRERFGRSGPASWPPAPTTVTSAEARIVRCPDPTLDGRTFAEVAAERGHGRARHLPRPADRLRERPALVQRGGQRQRPSTSSGSWPTPPP